jgi:hypothetical protein
MKSRILIIIAFTSCLFLCNYSKKSDSGLSIFQLRCSGLENPVGIGLTPDFSWMLKGSHRGKLCWREQTYRWVIRLNSFMIFIIFIIK